jgi:putative nucleotidyltransferase with HDIG domain
LGVSAAAPLCIHRSLQTRAANCRIVAVTGVWWNVSSMVESPQSDVLKAPNDLRAALRERLAEGKLDLPILPEVAMQVVRLTTAGDCGARELAELIRRDQAIAGHLLRIANSALYSRGVSITSLQMALSRLGMARIREMTLAISCQSRVFSARGREGDVRRVFRHSLAAAMFASEIARTQRRNVDEAFLLGLLHDVGRPVVMQALADLTAERTCALTEVEYWSAVDEAHAEVGADILAKWGLSEKLVEAVRHHHAAAVEPGLSCSWAQIRLADDLAHWAIEGDATSFEPLREHPCLDILNIYPDDLDLILQQHHKVIATLECYA